MRKHSLKISLDQDVVVNIVVAEKMSKMYTRNDLSMIM